MSSRRSTRQAAKPADEAERTSERISPASSANRQWSTFVKGITMGWINTFWASGEAEPADPRDDTVINGAPYDAHKAIRSDAGKVAVPVDRQNAQIAEEIKRRQISLAVRYVAAVRAR